MFRKRRLDKRSQIRQCLNPFRQVDDLQVSVLQRRLQVPMAHEWPRKGPGRPPFRPQGRSRQTCSSLAAREKGGFCILTRALKRGIRPRLACAKRWGRERHAELGTALGQGEEAGTGEWRGRDSSGVVFVCRRRSCAGGSSRRNRSATSQGSAGPWWRL